MLSFTKTKRQLFWTSFDASPGEIPSTHDIQQAYHQPLLLPSNSIVDIDWINQRPIVFVGTHKATYERLRHSLAVQTFSAVAYLCVPFYYDSRNCVAFNF